MGGAPNGIPTAVEPGDFELKDVEVKTAKGHKVHCTEMTLRQRDVVAQMLKDLAADETVMSVLGPMLTGVKPGEDMEIDVMTMIRAVSSKVSEGWLTRLLCEAVLNAPENRELVGPPGGGSLDWALDNLRLSDESLLLNGFKETNDLGKYLGNLMGLLSLGAQVKAGEAQKPPEA